MSFAGAIDEALRIARRNLGDAIVQATLHRVESKTYDSATGTYSSSPSEIAIDGVIDQFTFLEQSAEDYQATDVKFSIFNPNNDIVIEIQDEITLHEVKYRVHRVKPVYIGGRRPLITVILKK